MVMNADETLQSEHFNEGVSIRFDSCVSFLSRIFFMILILDNMSSGSWIIAYPKEENENDMTMDKTMKNRYIILKLDVFSIVIETYQETIRCILRCYQLAYENLQTLLEILFSS